MDLTFKTELSTVRHQWLWISMHSESWESGKDWDVTYANIFECVPCLSSTFDASHA